MDTKSAHGADCFCPWAITDIILGALVSNTGLNLCPVILSVLVQAQKLFHILRQDMPLTCQFFVILVNKN